MRIILMTKHITYKLEELKKIIEETLKTGEGEFDIVGAFYCLLKEIIELKQK
jgi:hypothetical protein